MSLKQAEKRGFQYFPSISVIKYRNVIIGKLDIEMAHDDFTWSTLLVTEFYF